MRTFPKIAVGNGFCLHITIVSDAAQNQRKIFAWCSCKTNNLQIYNCDSNMMIAAAQGPQINSDSI